MSTLPVPFGRGADFLRKWARQQLEAGVPRGVLYLAMRYVSGPSLQSLIRERGTLSTGESLRLADQIGGALDAAHRAGLVHRDVKPANILLAEPDDSLDNPPTLSTNRRLSRQTVHSLGKLSTLSTDHRLSRRSADCILEQICTGFEQVCTRTEPVRSDKPLSY